MGRKRPGRITLPRYFSCLHRVLMSAGLQYHHLPNLTPRWLRDLQMPAMPVQPSWATIPLPPHPFPPAVDKATASRFQDDCRCCQRSPAVLIARVREHTSDGPISWTGMLVNFSEGGFALEARTLPPIGALLEIDLCDALNQKYAQIVARVVWSSHRTPALPTIGCVVLFSALSPMAN
jgi:hypothetical protein